MKKIQCVYTENRYIRCKTGRQQILTFFLLVENLGYFKQIDVVWAGEDAVWHESSALFHSRISAELEYWQVSLVFQEHESIPLPGSILYSMRYRMNGVEFWDNNLGINYHSAAKSGIVLAPAISVKMVAQPEQISPEQKFLPVQVAIDPTLNPEKVILHWTLDNWRTSRQTPCHPENSNLHRTADSSSAKLWKGRLSLKNVFRIQFCIACHYKERIIWDNNFGQN
jgi:maltose 6'-phosphate phosphatase